MAWVGLERYGYLEDAQRLAYRFLYMYVSFQIFVTYALNAMLQDDHCFRRFQRSGPGEGDSICFVRINDHELTHICSSMLLSSLTWSMQSMGTKASTSRWYRGKVSDG